MNGRHGGERALRLPYAMIVCSAFHITSTTTQHPEGGGFPTGPPTDGIVNANPKTLEGNTPFQTALPVGRDLQSVVE